MTKRESFRPEEKPPSLREVARRSRDGRSELGRQSSLSISAQKETDLENISCKWQILWLFMV